MKSKNGKQHVTTFCGSISNPSYTDFVYWLNQHLVSSFGISIKDIHDNINSVKGTPDHIWKWTPEAMSIKLRYFFF